MIKLSKRILGLMLSFLMVFSVYPTSGIVRAAGDTYPITIRSTPPTGGTVGVTINGNAPTDENNPVGEQGDAVVLTALATGEAENSTSIGHRFYSWETEGVNIPEGQERVNPLSLEMPDGPVDVKTKFAEPASHTWITRKWANKTRLDLGTQEGIGEAFDGNGNTKYLPWGNSAPYEIEWDYDRPLFTTAYYLQRHNEGGLPERNPASWKLYGRSNNDAGTEWILLDEVATDDNVITGTPRMVGKRTLQNPGTYQYFRLEISATQGSSGNNFVAIAELGVYYCSESFVEVDHLENLPSEAAAEKPFMLSANVMPADATNKNIAWSITPGKPNTAGATITDGVLNTTQLGEVTVTAKITDGQGEGVDFVKDDIRIDVKSATVLNCVAIEGNNMPIVDAVENNDYYIEGTNMWSQNMSIVGEHNVFGNLAGSVPFGIENNWIRWANVDLKQGITGWKLAYELNTDIDPLTADRQVEVLVSQSGKGINGAIWHETQTISSGATSILTILPHEVATASPGGTYDVYVRWKTSGLVFVGLWLDLSEPLQKLPIEAATINVKGPRTGQTPNTVATVGAGSKFTAGTVSWTPADSTFQDGVQYKAEVTLTANESYTFQGMKNARINSADATVTDNIFTKVTLSRTFSPTNGEFIPVTNIELDTDTVKAGHSLNLSSMAKVEPSEADNQIIAWELVDAGGVIGVSATDVENGILKGASAGTVKVKATIEDGLSNGTSFTKDLTISVLAKEEGWNLVNPSNLGLGNSYVVVSANEGGGALANESTLVPAGNGITESRDGLKTKPVTINNNKITSEVDDDMIWKFEQGDNDEGKNYKTAEAPNGYGYGFAITNGSGRLRREGSSSTKTAILSTATGGDYWHKNLYIQKLTDETASLFFITPIDNSTDPEQRWNFALLGNENGFVGEGGDVTGTHEENGVSIQTIWENAPLKFYENGENYVAALDIVDIPTNATVGVPLPLTGTVSPANATNNAIMWSIVKAGTTGASLGGENGTDLITTAVGTATIRATIAGGIVDGNYVKDFQVTVGLPSVPGKATLSSAVAGNAQIELTWTAPTTGGPVMGYEYSTDNGTTWKALTGTTTQNITQTSASGTKPLVNGTTYNCMVRAVNAGGSGASSNNIAATPALDVTWSSLTANGANNVENTTELTLAFNVDPVGLTASQITVTGATIGALSGTGKTRTLAISNITVDNGTEITISITDSAGLKITSPTPAAKTVIVYKDVTDPVAKVIALISAIVTPVMPESESNIKAAEEAYDALNQDQKESVTNATNLTDIKAAFVVVKMIAALKTPITLESEANIVAARKAYEGLTLKQKNLVGNYSVLLDLNQAQDITKATVSTVATQNFTGKALTPAITITLAGKALTKNKDYIVSYGNNVKIGTATITITGKGSYKGTITRTFSIAVFKNKTYTVGKYKYKLTNANLNGKGTVTVSGVKNKKLKSIKVENTVTIGSKKFKVTAVGASAFESCNKATSVTLGTNVKTIGKNAFNKASKLKNITIKSTKLKSNSVGKNAFKGINSTAKIKVPKKKYSTYKKYLNNKGQKSTVKIIK